MSEDPRQYLNDNEEAARLAQDGHQSRIWTAMPAIVQTVDLAKMTCVVQLAVQGRFEDNQGNITWTNIGVLHDVPLVFPRAGGFSITFPVAAGDEVLVVFASRCIDFWWQNGGYANKPAEYRMHDLSDGFAIPGPSSQPRVLSAISATDIQIRDTAGTTFFAVGGVDHKFAMKNPTTDLKTLLNLLTTDLNTFATACASATTVANVAAAGTALAGALTAVTTAIGALLK